MSELKTENELVESVKKQFGDKILDTKIQRAKRVYIKVKPGDHRDVIKFLKDNWDAYHVSTITGVDLGENIEVLYHLFAYKGNITVTVRTEVPKADPKIQTIVDIIPGATLYEREVHDLLGVVFEGHPELERLILPDDWPEGVYPLRKEYKLEVEEAGKEGKEGE